MCRANPTSTQVVESLKHAESKIRAVRCRGVTMSDQILQISRQTLRFLGFPPTLYQKIRKIRRNPIHIEDVLIYGGVTLREKI